MATITGSEVLAKALLSQGMDTMFYMMGGPMMETEAASIEVGIRAIDIRHEQAAAMMAHAYGRVMRRPGVCMGASGPGATNLVTGVANALADAAPLIAIGGSSPRVPSGWRRSRRWTSSRSSSRSPSGRSGSTTPSASPRWSPPRSARRRPAGPGPSTSTCPATSSARRSTRTTITYAPKPWSRRRAPSATRPPIDEAIALLAQAERPLIIGGSGIWWSDAAAAFQAFVEATGIPFYTTPISRGTVPDDHALSFLTARATAFREADVAPGRRHPHQLRDPVRPAAALRRRRQGHPGRHRPDRDRPQPPGRRRRSSATRAPCSSSSPPRRAARSTRSATRAGPASSASSTPRRRAEPDKAMSTDDTPIHPLRLCKEVRDFLRSRRDPGRRRPGDPELRSPVDPDVRGRPSAELRRVRHDGRRPAVRRRRQGRQARHAGARAARRRLVRPQRDGDRHGGAAQHSGRGA